MATRKYTEEELMRRRARVLSLRAAGLSPAAIARQEAEEQGGGRPRSVKAINDDIEAALRDRKQADTDHKGLLVTLEMERLDAVQRIMEAVLRSSQGGRCNACGRGGDPALAQKTAMTLIRISERRSALVGLDKRFGVPEEPPASPIDEIKARRDRKMKEIGL